MIKVPSKAALKPAINLQMRGGCLEKTKTYDLENYELENDDLENDLMMMMIQWGVEILLVASYYGNRYKLRSDEPLGSYTDLTFSKGRPK